MEPPTVTDPRNPPEIRPWWKWNLSPFLSIFLIPLRNDYIGNNNKISPIIDYVCVCSFLSVIVRFNCTSDSLCTRASFRKKNSCIPFQSFLVTDSRLDKMLCPSVRQFGRQFGCLLGTCAVVSMVLQSWAVYRFWEYKEKIFNKCAYWPHQKRKQKYYW